MNQMKLDFARCRCGYATPIRPSIPVGKGFDPRTSGMETEPLFVGCTRCKRVTRFLPQELEPGESWTELAPYNHESPMRVFPIRYECDELGCEAQATVLVALKSTTTAAELVQVKRQLKWSDQELKCEAGHPQPYPHWE